MHWLLERLDKLLENRKYALGDYISIVDFRLLEVSETFIAFKGEAFKEFKNLSIHHETMINVPQIKVSTLLIDSNIWPQKDFPHNHFILWELHLAGVEAINKHKHNKHNKNIYYI